MQRMLDKRTNVHRSALNALLGVCTQRALQRCFSKACANSLEKNLLR
jgi:hypothetical protein